MWQTNLPGRSSHQHEPTVVTTKTCMYGCLVGDYFIMICIYDMSLCDQPTGKIVSSTWTHYHLRHCLVRHRLVHRLIDFVSARSCWETWCSGPPSRLQLHDKQTHSRATIAPDGEGWRWGWRWSRGGGEMGRMIWWEVRITAWYRTNEYGVGGEKAIDQWSALTEEMSVDTQM